MRKILARIGLLAGGLIVVFLTFFFAFEQSTIERTEREIEETYKAVLQPILFSVNQVSQSNVDSWISRAASTLDGNDINTTRAEGFLMDHLFVQSVSVMTQDFETVSAFPAEGSPAPVTLLRANNDQIQPLFSYLEADYQKIVPVTDTVDFYLVFALHEPENMLGMIKIDPVAYISEVLAPRLQQVAGGEMILSVFSDFETLVYSTDETNLDLGKVIRIDAGDLWLFPSYAIGVSFRGETLSDLVQERMRNNLLLILMLAAVLLIGIYFIVGAIRRELQLSKMKSDFVSNVSHEIRTPLALISMFAETLELGRVRSDEERHKFYHIIHSETRRLSGLVNRILSFSKMQAGKRRYSMEKLNASDIVKDVLAAYDYHLSNQQFTCNIDINDRVMIEGDRDAVYEATVNLLDNAMKYSGEQKVMDIKVTVDNGHGKISIQDHGLGIPVADQKRVFEKFYRAEDPHVHNTKGSGLGLNIVSEIMAAHGGSVDMLSTPGVGSTFTLIFPLNEEQDTDR